MPASKEKFGFLAHAGVATTGSDAMETRFLIVSLDSINTLLCCVQPKLRGGGAAASKNERECGVAIKIVISSAINGYAASAQS